MSSLEVKYQDLLGDATYRLKGVSFLLGKLIEAEREHGSDEASSAFYSLQSMTNRSIEEIDQVINECSS